MDQADYDRLQRLVARGDRDAAKELMTESARRGDTETRRAAAEQIGAPRQTAKRYTLKRTRKLKRVEPRWDTDLNDQQRAVVEAGAGPLLVVAGAGSGKTRTLTYRVARLVDMGVAPERILLLTFTNRAAREMVRRVDELVEGHAERIHGGTFHHIGHRILRRHAEKLGYTDAFGIMDGEDASTLMGACIADLELAATRHKRRFPRGDLIQRMHSMAINTARPLADVVRENASHYEELVPEIAAVCERYVERKQQMGLMDYDDLLLNWRRLMLEHPDVGRAIAAHYEHVLVDEYQDTNALQGELVDLCASKHQNVMVVGDDCQSIYGFRGANFENILRFPERYPDCRKFLLETNYRSTPQIVALANESITFNERRFDKTLRAHREPGTMPSLVPARDLTQQADFVTERILELHETGMRLRNMAVLYRAHYQSVEIQLALTRAQIPFTVRSGLRFFEQAHVKDVISFLRFVFNPDDELSFMRVAKLAPGIGNTYAQRIWEALDDVFDAENRLDALFRIDATSVLPRKDARTSFERLRELLEDLASGDLWRMPGEMVGRVIDSEDYDAHVRTTYANAENRLGDLEQLSRYAAQFDDVEAFLGELALVSGLSGEDIAEGGTPDDRVVLSSVHQAKGLEWPVVFVTSLWDGGFPTGRGQETREAEEEERRLFYVAVTRAMDELHLCYPLSRRDRGGHHRVLRPSPFIKELYDEQSQTPRSSFFEEWVLEPG